MKEEDKENIKEEITTLQNKLDDLINILVTEEPPAAGSGQQDEQDVVQNENIPVVYIDTAADQDEQE